MYSHVSSEAAMLQRLGGRKWTVIAFCPDAHNQGTSPPVRRSFPQTYK